MGAAKEPLDLRAVEEFVDAKYLPFTPENCLKLVDDVRALLAHCRALRVALRQFATLIEGDDSLGHLPDATELNVGVPGLAYGYARHFYRGIPRDLAQAELRRHQAEAGNERWEPPTLGDLRRAAAVLAQAQDEPA